ncbi:DUF924 family protein [Aliagarivorans marinus]|uniref:DUF924 family protein n=1 Tax=Aliagarivorans marinus TaxID=561965 RepID=UPI0003F72FDE|nr:DUF924 family protein [Aliagarivorans marinus]
MHYMDVLNFWFSECRPAQWFEKDLAFDREVERRFAAFHRAAAAGELAHWRLRPQGSLAEVIVLDQFSRNIFRDSPQAFAYDSVALVLAQQAIANYQDKVLAPIQRAFLYMPFMHSESRVIQQQSVALFSQPGLEQNYDFALQHARIIERFGRYPHRNTLLGRTSSSEEREFLNTPGSSF